MRLCLSVALWACDGSARERGTASAALNAATPPPRAAGEATPHRAGLPQDGARPGRDLGRGVLATPVRDFGVTDVADTLIVRAAPASDAPVVARYLHTRPDWAYTLETTEPNLVRNDIEFEYETSGLPVDSTADGWARVIFAFAPDATPRTGWSRLEESVQLHEWTARFAQSNLFFLDMLDIAFHDSPGGSRLHVPLARDENGRFDYTLHPGEVADGWMRVRLVTPSDYCFFPDHKSEHEVWVRLLDQRGRPRVFYHSRGC